MSNYTKTTCRDIGELNKNAQQACRLFLDRCKSRGIDIFITETYRSQERQDYLYSKGRTISGQIVTNAKYSNHTSKMAWDIACNGANLYDPKILNRAGQVAKELGITWGGSWVKFVDKPHFEVTKNWTYKEVSNMTVDEAKKIIQENCDFNDTTMLYLTLYKYSDSMLIRLAQTMKG